MNEPINKPLLLKCSKCGYEFYTKAKGIGTTCSKCRKWILIPANADRIPANADIQDDIASGHIIDALNKTNMNPITFLNVFFILVPSLV